MMSDFKRQRRFLKTRQARWANVLAQKLSRTSIKPNQISILSIIFSFLAAVSLLMLNEPMRIERASIFYVFAALFIQLRLLCNMLDGMLAIECGLKTKTGEIFNELPDRISDSMILICAGYAVSLEWGVLGWASAILALGTAYIRLLGVSLNTNAYFNGPMAKPHRMFTLTVACLLSAILNPLRWDEVIMMVALVVIAMGSLVTCVRRIYLIVKEINFYDR